MLRRFFISLMVLLLICCQIAASVPAYESKVTREDVYNAALKTIKYYHEKYRQNEYDGILDWPALGLFGFGEDISGPKWTVNGKNAAHFREQEVREGIGLSTIKNTDFQRTIIGVCSAGKDPRNFGGKNLVETVKGTMLPNGHFADSVADRKTGKPVGEDLVNAHIFGIIAMHVAGEPIPNRDKCLEWLANTQHPDGGFTFDVKYFDNPEDYDLIESDVDMTAAALMGFAILGEDRSNPAVARAIEFLKKVQLDNGGFSSWGTVNPESCAWVTQSLTLLGIDPMGPEWTKPSGGNPVSAMLRFQLSDGSFTHVLDEADNLPIYDNAMSTYEGLYGMADAYNKKSAYDMLHEKYKEQAKAQLFNDLKPKDFGFEEIMDLVYSYILSGNSDGSFAPDRDITRAEIAKIIVRTLGKETEAKSFKGSEKFRDISADHWADEYMGYCADRGIFTGTGKDVFSPDKGITGAELAVVAVKVAGFSDEAESLKENGQKWDKAYMEIAQNKGLLYPDYDGEQTVNRAQSAWVISKLRALLDKN